MDSHGKRSYHECAGGCNGFFWLIGLFLPEAAVGRSQHLGCSCSHASSSAGFEPTQGLSNRRSGILAAVCSHVSSSAGFEPTQRLSNRRSGILAAVCSHASSSAGFEPTQRGAARSACLAVRRVRRLAAKIPDLRCGVHWLADGFTIEIDRCPGIEQETAASPSSSVGLMASLIEVFRI